MKRLIISIFLGLAFGAAASAQIPSVEIQDISGAKFDTALIADGRTPAVISFWSVTCKPCIQELDAINEALEEWLKETEFRVVAVSTDDTRFNAKAKALTESHGWGDFTLLFDINSDFKRAMNVVYTPQLYIIDAEGRIVYSHTGYTPGGEDIILEELLKTAGHNN